MLGAVGYIGLLALPFVPGAEIGLAMLAAFGPAIAPLIYVCTVASMILAYTAGRFLPIDVLRRVLSVLRMHRAAELVARAAPLSGEDRVAMLLQGQSARSAASCGSLSICRTGRGGEHARKLGHRRRRWHHADGGPQRYIFSTCHHRDHRSCRFTGTFGDGIFRIAVLTRERWYASVLPQGAIGKRCFVPVHRVA